MTMKYRKTNRLTGEYYQWNDIGGRSTIESTINKNGFKMNTKESEVFQYLHDNHVESTEVGVFNYSLITNN